MEDYEILRGDVYYDYVCNEYYIVTNSLGRERFICMVFDGYETDHTYLQDEILYKIDFHNESRMYKVGGIY